MKKEMTRNKTWNLDPAPRPPMEKIMAATSVLQDQVLAVYQRLYKVGLTSPGKGGWPFEARISVEHLACIEIVNKIEPKFNFLLGPHDDIESVVPKCEAIFASINGGETGLAGSKACCSLAKTRFCVCDASFECPVHGITCHGSHD